MSKFIASLMLCVAASMATLGSEVQTTDVTIKYVSVTAVDGQVLVQTMPRHVVAGLSCTSNFWAVLDKSASGYSEALSLATAGLLDTRVMDITVSDEITTGNYCTISRLVLK